MKFLPVALLKDKKADIKFYSAFQNLSNDGIIMKKDMPAQDIICQQVGIRSKVTYRGRLDYLILNGYIVEESDRFVLPKLGFCISLGTYEYLCKWGEEVIRTYIDLGEKYIEYGRKSQCYTFDEGQYDKNVLNLLYNSKLTDYSQGLEGKIRLVGFKISHRRFFE